MRTAPGCAGWSRRPARSDPAAESPPLLGSASARRAARGRSRAEDRARVRDGDIDTTFQGNPDRLPGDDHKHQESHLDAEGVATLVPANGGAEPPRSSFRSDCTGRPGQRAVDVSFSAAFGVFTRAKRVPVSITSHTGVPTAGDEQWPGETAAAPVGRGAVSIPRAPAAFSNARLEMRLRLSLRTRRTVHPRDR